MSWSRQPPWGSSPVRFGLWGQVWVGRLTSAAVSVAPYCVGKQQHVLRITKAEFGDAYIKLAEAICSRLNTKELSKDSIQICNLC